MQYSLVGTAVRIQHAVQLRGPCEAVGVMLLVTLVVACGSFEFECLTSVVLYACAPHSELGWFVFIEQQFLRGRGARSLTLWIRGVFIKLA